MSRRPMLVAVGVLKIDGKLAMIKFKRNILTGFWGLPGGKIDDGESLPTAVERELFEELGLAVKFQELLGVMDEEIITMNDTQHFMMFVCSVIPTTKFSPKRIDHDEGVVDWFSEQQIRNRKMPLVPSDYQVIDRVALGKERGYFYSKIDVSGKEPILLRFESTNSASPEVPERY